MRNRIRAALGLGAALSIAVPALAQAGQDGAGDRQSGGPSGGVVGYISLGAGLIPDYQGSQDYRATPFLEGRLNSGNYYLRFEGGALRANLLDSEHIHLGPLLGFRRGRGDVANRAVSRLRHIKGSLTAGGFVEYENVHTDPRSAERVTLQVDDDVTGDDSGWQVTLRGVVRRPLDFIDRGFIASLEVDTSWAGQTYMQQYFDVTAAGAVRSGLPAYGASAGFKNVGAAVSLNQYLSRHWNVGVIVHYTRLRGAAAHSPVTAIAGSQNQIFAGLVAGYVL